MARIYTPELGPERLVRPGKSVWRVRGPACEAVRPPLLDIEVRSSCDVRRVEEAQRQAQLEAPRGTGSDYWLG